MDIRNDGDNNKHTQGDKNEVTSDINAISGDDIQRLASDYGKQKGSQDAKHTSDLEEEILASFGNTTRNIDEAITSLGDAGATGHESEEAYNLDNAENLSQATQQFNDYGDQKNKENDGVHTQQQEIEELENDIDFEYRENLSTQEDDLPLSGIKKQPEPNLPDNNDSNEPSLQNSQDINSIDRIPVLEQESGENQISNLEQEIVQDMSSDQRATTNQISNPEKQQPVSGRTYYDDLSKAMSSSKPKTMSELLRKSSFEEKERKILSPTSRKNILYITGILVLLFVSVATWFFIFQPNEQVEFITEQRVSSLVYSDQDLGINLTGLETFKTKEAIRDVLERKQDPDTLSQIYYVERQSENVVRRLGIEEVFRRTENQTPEILYENIDEEFMHGVYSSDNNYPFIILKARSYDRAFEGMKQWEPTMIDDLATYFDLPPEAVDRSLLQDGFSDDLIENKNVRVARYIPRESDRRGILDILNLSNRRNTTEVPENDPTIYDEFIDEDLFLNEDNQNISSLLQRIFATTKTPEVFAQNEGGIGGTFIDNNLNQGGSRTVCFPSERRCIDITNGQTLPGNTTPSATVRCYDDIQFVNPTTGQPYQGLSPEQVGGQSGYTCREVLSGGDSIGTEGTQIDTLNRQPVCFDPISGNRLNPDDPQTDTIENPQALCFTPFQCKRIACFSGGQEVSSQTFDAPGVTCQVTNEVVEPDADVRKSCVQFNELLTLQNLDNLNLCFDDFGRFVPINDNVQSIEDYYQNSAINSQRSVQQVLQEGSAFSCISPQSRYSRLCLTENDQIIDGTNITPVSTNQAQIESTSPEYTICTAEANEQWSENMESFENGDSLYTSAEEIDLVLQQQLAQCEQNFPPEMILNTTVDYPDGIVTCFEPVTSFVNQSGGLGEMYEGGINQDIRAFSATIAQQLQVLAGIASGFGFFDNDVSETLQDTAQVFWQIAYGNVLENEIVMTIASNTRRLEIILNRIEPVAPNSQLIAELRSIIQLIKQAVGLEYNVAWVTLAGQLPQGVNIYPGDELSSGPQMEAIQEALVLLGLMDPLSVTGELDLVTQQALATFQEINGISFLESGLGVTGQDGVDGQGGVTGGNGIGNQGGSGIGSQGSIALDQVFVSAEALELLQQMISSSSGIYNQAEAASIEDYFTEIMGLGAFSQDVMELQVLLYGLGYDISSFDGIFDEEVCLALQQYQLDNNLEVANSNDCEISTETLQSFNDMLRNEDILGSGFAINSNGALEGNGSFEDMFGPGAINFEVPEAEANSLREGDIVLMYTFLDEETILITRNEVIINEVIQRRALEDIFGQ
jgi:hypothetical protein